MGSAFSQFLPPAPQFTEKDIPDQKGRVFIVTGASSGVGKELTRILYSRNATVYLVGRSASRSLDTTSEIKSGFPDSKGNLIFIKADFEDLVSVKNGAKLFLQKEERLDGLWNNAGVMLPEPGNRTKQGYELQLGTNTLGPFLFSRLLTPILISTAKERKPGEVRIMWVASSAAELFTPKGGIDIENLDYKKDVSNTQKYGISKAGMILLNQEFARRHRVNGIISVAMNPGNIKTNLRRHLPWFTATIFGWISHDPIKGAYTELFAGFSPEIKMTNSGCWVIPWGRISPLRQDIQDSAIPKSEGGSGLAALFWDWCEGEIKNYSEI